ncbi:hypothetical protein F4677DRAFT_461123 [Hypoxylon crocopeplum]|nr:hypothetical protein F4677DRAFT_461123 [Hypoxylon crocopeplum]
MGFRNASNPANNSGGGLLPVQEMDSTVSSLDLANPRYIGPLGNIPVMVSRNHREDSISSRITQNCREDSISLPNAESNTENNTHKGGEEVKPYRVADNMNAATYHFVGTPPFGTFAERLGQIWHSSGFIAPKAADAFFTVKYLGVQVEPFEGLPAWAVLAPKDFITYRHIGSERLESVLTRRLFCKIKVDPSPQKKWVKPILTDLLVYWLDDDLKRVAAVQKLWEAYDFLWFWANNAASTGKTLPLNKSLDAYVEENTLNLRVRALEKMTAYRQQSAIATAADAGGSKDKAVEKEEPKISEYSYDGVDFDDECDSNVGPGKPVSAHSSMQL